MDNSTSLEDVSAFLDSFDIDAFVQFTQSLPVAERRALEQDMDRIANDAAATNTRELSAAAAQAPRQLIVPSQTPVRAYPRPVPAYAGARRDFHPPAPETAPRHPTLYSAEAVDTSPARVLAAASNPESRQWGEDNYTPSRSSSPGVIYASHRSPVFQGNQSILSPASPTKQSSSNQPAARSPPVSLTPKALLVSAHTRHRRDPDKENPAGVIDVDDPEGSDGGNSADDGKSKRKKGKRWPVSAKTRVFNAILGPESLLWKKHGKSPMYVYTKVAEDVLRGEYTVQSIKGQFERGLRIYQAAVKLENFTGGGGDADLDPHSEDPDIVKRRLDKYKTKMVKARKVGVDIKDEITPKAIDDFYRNDWYDLFDARYGASPKAGRDYTIHSGATLSDDSMDNLDSDDDTASDSSDEDVKVVAEKRKRSRSDPSDSDIAGESDAMTPRQPGATPRAKRVDPKPPLKKSKPAGAGGSVTGKDSKASIKNGRNVVSEPKHSNMASCREKTAQSLTGMSAAIASKVELDKERFALAQATAADKLLLEKRRDEREERRAERDAQREDRVDAREERKLRLQEEERLTQQTLDTAKAVLNNGQASQALKDDAEEAIRALLRRRLN